MSLNIDNLIIRPGKPFDMPNVLELFQELARAKGMEKYFTLTLSDLLKDISLKIPKFYTYVAEIDGDIIGVALFYKGYCSQGKSLILEDVFITKKYSESGVGLSLFAKYLEIANTNNIDRLEWSIFTDNKPLVELHNRAGATILHETSIYEIDAESLQANINNKIELQNTKDCIIRKGEIKDMEAVLVLLKSQSRYKKTISTLTVDNLIADGFGESPYFQSFVVEHEKEIVGFLIFHLTYSTLKGRSIIIEDVFIKQDFRKNGFGFKLYQEIFNYAFKQKKKRLSQAIFDWDAIAINKSLRNGAVKIPNVKLVQISAETLNNFINQ